jgi:hypothetical protein
VLDVGASAPRWGSVELSVGRHAHHLFSRRPAKAASAQVGGAELRGLAHGRRPMERISEFVFVSRPVVVQDEL